MSHHGSNYGQSNYGQPYRKPNNPNQSNMPMFNGMNSSGDFLGSINKDNIFEQTPEMLQQLIFSPPKFDQQQQQQHQQRQEKPQFPQQTATNNVDQQETQKLTNFLSTLGFQLGNNLTLQTNNVPPNIPQEMEVAVRSKDGIYLVNDKQKDYLGDKTKLISEEGTVTLFNQDGSMLAFATPSAVGVYVFAEKRTMIFNLPEVKAMHFSPGQRYLTTIDRRENRFFISIFEPNPLRKLFEFETVRYKKETWPQLKFTENDELAFWASKPTQIEVFAPRQNFRVLRTLNTKAFDFFDISVKMDNLMIVCIGLEKSAGYYGHEGSIDIYRYKDLDYNPNPILSKITDKAHEVNLFFSPTGQHLLIWAQTFTDKTGQSYYGEHMLLYLDLNKGVLKRVPTYKGPIHDVSWNPNGLEFIVISGFMPAGSVLFDNECIPKFEFGQHHRNTVRWSPLSRFVCLAGFGNLPGDIEIWDVYSLKQVGTCRSNTAVSCRWAPDGRKLLTGVLNPRLKVANNYKIFKYTGELLNTVDFSNSELYEVTWRPAKYTDKPASPTKLEKSESDKLTEKSDSDKDGKPQPEKKVFRPKIGGEFAAMLKAEKAAKATGRILNPDEIFGNEANTEDPFKPSEKKVEIVNPEKVEEGAVQPKPATKILRRVAEKTPEGVPTEGGEGQQLQQRKNSEK